MQTLRKRIGKSLLKCINRIRIYSVVFSYTLICDLGILNELHSEYHLSVKFRLQQIQHARISLGMLACCKPVITSMWLQRFFRGNQYAHNKWRFPRTPEHGVLVALPKRKVLLENKFLFE